MAASMKTYAPSRRAEVSALRMLLLEAKLTSDNIRYTSRMARRYVCKWK